MPEGSTQLYEMFGDTRAREIIASCLGVMTDVTYRHGGKLVKTIGDEVMVTFPIANAAAEAACSMQHDVSGQLVADGRPLAIRVGFHFGPALIEDADIFGDGVNVPARMANQAKARQILTTGATVAHLSGHLRESCRQIDLAQVRGKQERLAIYELVWESDGATFMQEPWPIERRGGTRLMLMGGGTQLELGDAFPTLTIGRSEQNDLVVRHPVVSRLHARIDYRNGRFVLTDQSANGTFVAVDGGRTTYVHRDHYVLTGSGILGLGQGVAEARVRYEYREIEPFGTASQYRSC
jgi:adenylate cyclase